jgi:hypothetical protein
VTVIQAGADHDRPDERTAAVAMLTEDYEYVIGGDPDRDTIDLAVLDTATGRTRAHLAAPADGAGYGQMLDWASQHASGRRVWALEGTGSFAAGLADALAEAGEDVVEVGALKRRRGAKSVFPTFDWFLLLALFLGMIRGHDHHCRHPRPRHPVADDPAAAPYTPTPLWRAAPCR